MQEPPLYLDNIIFSLQKAGGISVYWLELLNRLIPSTDRLIMFENENAANNLFRNKLTGETTIRREWGRLPAKIVRYLPLIARLKEPSIFHSSYYRISTQKNVANILTVYDFTYERFRNGLPKIIHYCQKRSALNRVDGIICISESTKEDLLRYFPELEEKDIIVTYLGVSEKFYVLSDTPQIDEKMRDIISTKYVIFIGARTAYKNFDLAVDVVKRITDCSLLVIGGGELSSLEISVLKNKLSGRFWHCRYVDDTILNLLYNHAFCLLYPSSYEGFGIPVIEAMSAGCPVVAVNVSSIPEACGNAGLLVDKPDVDDFAESMKLLEDLSYRQNLIQNGIDHSGKFSWDLCYQKTKEFYSKVFFKKFGT